MREASKFVNAERMGKSLVPPLQFEIVACRFVVDWNVIGGGWCSVDYERRAEWDSLKTCWINRQTTREKRGLTKKSGNNKDIRKGAACN